MTFYVNINVLQFKRQLTSVLPYQCPACSLFFIKTVDDDRTHGSRHGYHDQPFQGHDRFINKRKFIPRNQDQGHYQRRYQLRDDYP